MREIKESPENNYASKKNIAGSILFLLWFLISIIVLVAAAKKGMTWLVISVFGQYFLVLGSAVCIKLAREKKLLCNSMIFSIVTLGFLALLYGIDASDGVQTEGFLTICGISIAGCGIIVLTGPGLDACLKKRRCSIGVDADVIEVRTVINTRHTSAGTKRVKMYCPIYEIYYRGKKYILQSGYFDKNEIHKGQMAHLMINPENPEDFYNSSRMRELKTAYSIFGVCYIAAGIALLYITKMQ